MALGGVRLKRWAVTDVLPAVVADLERRIPVVLFGRLRVASAALIVKDKALGAPPCRLRGWVRWLAPVAGALARLKAASLGVAGERRSAFKGNVGARRGVTQGSVEGKRKVMSRPDAGERAGASLLWCGVKQEVAKWRG